MDECRFEVGANHGLKFPTQIDLVPVSTGMSLGLGFQKSHKVESGGHRPTWANTDWLRTHTDWHETSRLVRTDIDSFTQSLHQKQYVGTYFFNFLFFDFELWSYKDKYNLNPYICQYRKGTYI